MQAGAVGHANQVGNFHTIPITASCIHTISLQDSWPKIRRAGFVGVQVWHKLYFPHEPAVSVPMSRAPHIILLLIIRAMHGSAVVRPVVGVFTLQALLLMIACAQHGATDILATDICHCVMTQHMLCGFVEVPLLRGARGSLGLCAQVSGGSPLLVALRHLMYTACARSPPS